MPMGPAELADTVGLDICLAAGKSLAKDATDIPRGAREQGGARPPRQEDRAKGIYRWEDGKAVKGAPDAYDPDLVDSADRALTCRGRGARSRKASSPTPTSPMPA